MPIMGLTYRKLMAERTGTIVPETKIKTVPKVTDIRKVKIAGLGEPMNALNIAFEYESVFEPGVGKILVAGDILYNTSEAVKIAEGWTKDKDYPAGLKVEILNHILRRASIQALMLSDTLQMPPVIHLPKIEIAELTESKEGKGEKKSKKK